MCVTELGVTQKRDKIIEGPYSGRSPAGSHSTGMRESNRGWTCLKYILYTCEIVNKINNPKLILSTEYGYG